MTEFQVESQPGVSWALTSPVMSSHVTESTLRWLNGCRETPDSSLIDFRKQHWGRRNGTIVTFEDGGLSRTVLCINNRFDLDSSSPLLVRKVYVELWKYLCRNYLDFGTARRFGTIVYGSRGIGKTSSLYFLMCAAAEHQVPFVFHRTGTSTAFVCLDAGSFFIPAHDVETIGFRTRALILIDSCTPDGLPVDVYKVPGIHVVVASPPEPRRYHSFAKEKSAMFYMLNLVDRAEFRAILHLRTLRADAPGTPVLLLSDEHIFPAPVSPEDEATFRPPAGAVWSPLEVFDICGPDLCWALKNHLRVSGDAYEVLPLMNLRRVFQRVLGESVSADFASTVDLQLGDLILTELRIFLYGKPGRYGPVFHSPGLEFVIPTRYLRRAIHDAVGELDHQDQLCLLARLQLFETIHDVILEGVIFDHLATAPLTVFVPSNSSAESSRPTASFIVFPQDSLTHSYTVTSVFPHTAPAGKTATQLAQEGDANGLVSIEDQLGFCILPIGFPGADAIGIAGGVEGNSRYELIFQVTVSGAHPIKQRAIDSITTALDAHPCEGKRRRVFVFVSDGVAKCEALASCSYPPLAGWEVGYVSVTKDQLSRQGGNV